MYKNTKFSKIIAGTMTWGSWGKNFNQNEMANHIHWCMDLGITSFDHADIYGGYSTEVAFGKAFAKSQIARDKMQLITKCGIQLVDDSRGTTVKHYDYSKEYIVWSAEKSLSALKTDYIDLFLLHRPSPLMHPVAIAEAVSKLLKEGKIKSFGVSNFSSAQIALIETEIIVTGNQLEFSLTANEAMNNGTLDDSLANNRMLMSWSPLGLYFRENNAQTNRIRKLMETLTEKYNATADQLLLAWLLKHPVGAHPVVGTTSKERLKDSFDAVQIELELEDWFLLLEASNGQEVL